MKAFTFERPARATDAASAGVNAFAPSFDVGFYPESGAVGKAVTIVGLHFKGVTEVLFNGVPAKFSSSSRNRVGCGTGTARLSPRAPSTVTKASDARSRRSG